MLNANINFDNSLSVNVPRYAFSTSTSDSVGSFTRESNHVATSSTENLSTISSLSLSGSSSTMKIKSYSSLILFNFAHLSIFPDRNSKQQINVVVMFFAVLVVAGGM